MTENQLDAIRAEAAKSTPHSCWRGRCAVCHRRELLAAIAERDAMIAERDHLIWVLQRDQDAYQRGRDDGRREVAEWLGEEAGRLLAKGKEWSGDDFCDDFRRSRAEHCRELSHAIRSRGDTLPPLPPDQVRARADRLEAALREIARDDGTPAASIARRALEAP